MGQRRRRLQCYDSADRLRRRVDILIARCCGLLAAVGRLMALLLLRQCSGQQRSGHSTEHITTSAGQRVEGRRGQRQRSCGRRVTVGSGASRASTGVGACSIGSCVTHSGTSTGSCGEQRGAQQRDAGVTSETRTGDGQAAGGGGGSSGHLEMKGRQLSGARTTTERTEARRRRTTEATSHSDRRCQTTTGWERGKRGGAGRAESSGVGGGNSGVGMAGGESGRWDEREWYEGRGE